MGTAATAVIRFDPCGISVSRPGGAMLPLVCLAMAVYFEARSEPLAGQLAVAQTVINRVESRRFPGDVCSVVYQGGEVRARCQFSFYCDGLPETIFNVDAWEKSVIVAGAALLGAGKLVLPENVLHYHADYVRPTWASTMTITTQIGEHVFYE